MYDPDSDAAFLANNEQKSANYVKFYRQWLRDNFLSEKEGREVGAEHDFILIISPGQSKTEVRRKVTEADRVTYAGEWAAYQAGKEHQVSGTPIEKLPGLASGMADALKALHIHSIEQMAALPDIAMQKVGMGANDIRNRARAYLSNGSAEVATLKEQLKAAQARIAELEAAAQTRPAGPGRPRKAKPVDEPAVLQ